MNLILLSVSCGDVLKRLSSQKCLQVNMGVGVQVGGIKKYEKGGGRKSPHEVNKGAAQLENVRGCK